MVYMFYVCAYVCIQWVVDRNGCVDVRMDIRVFGCRVLLVGFVCVCGVQMSMCVEVLGIEIGFLVGWVLFYVFQGFFTCGLVIFSEGFVVQFWFSQLSLVFLGFLYDFYGKKILFLLFLQLVFYSQLVDDVIMDRFRGFLLIFGQCGIILFRFFNILFWCVWEDG